MYSNSLKHRWYRVRSFIRHFGLMLAIAAILLAIVGYGAYRLAVADPATKLAVNLGTMLTYNLITVMAMRNLAKGDDWNEKLGAFYGGAIEILSLVGPYSFVLSIFVVPLFFAILTSVYVVSGFGMYVLDKKKIAIPLPVFRSRWILATISFGGFLYYLLMYLNWF